MRTLKDRVEECTRRHPGVTQADIARAAGIKQPSVTDWFNGKTVSLKLKPAVKAAALWGCDPLWLGEGEGLPDWVDAAPVESPPTSLGQALERLGIELAKPMADDDQGRNVVAGLCGEFVRGGPGDPPGAQFGADIPAAGQADQAAVGLHDLGHRPGDAARVCSSAI